MARGKSWVVGQLRKMMSVSDVAEVLGLRPPTVYAILNGVPEDAEVDDLPVLMERLAEIQRQAQNCRQRGHATHQPEPRGDAATRRQPSVGT